MILEYFVEKSNALKRAAELRAEGYNNVPRVKTVRNCVLSPDAVLDYTGYTSPNGFGGPADQWWARLYKIEVWL